MHKKHTIHGVLFALQNTVKNMPIIFIFSVVSKTVMWYNRLKAIKL